MIRDLAGVGKWDTFLLSTIRLKTCGTLVSWNGTGVIYTQNELHEVRGLACREKGLPSSVADDEFLPRLETEPATEDDLPSHLLSSNHARRNRLGHKRLSSTASEPRINT